MALVPAICTQCGAKLEVDWGDYQYLFEILSIDGDIVKTSPYLNCNKYFDNYYPVKRVDFNVFPYMRIVSLDIKNCKVVIEFNNQRFDLFKDKNCFEYDPIEFIGSEAAVQLYFDYRENYLTRCSNIEFEEGVDKKKYIDYLEKKQPQKLGKYSYDEVLKFIGEDHYYVADGRRFDFYEMYISNCPEVWTLRRFRDNTLYKTSFGRTFIKIYYTISPLLVKCFGNCRLIKKSWKMFLDCMVSKLNSSGYSDTKYNDR